MSESIPSERPSPPAESDSNARGKSRDAGEAPSIGLVQAKLLHLAQTHRLNSALLWYIEKTHEKCANDYRMFGKTIVLSLFEAFRNDPTLTPALSLYLSDLTEFNNRPLLEKYISLIETTVAYLTTPAVAKEPLSAPSRWRELDRIKTYTHLNALMMRLCEKPNWMHIIDAIRDDMFERFVSGTHAERVARGGRAYRDKVARFIEIMASKSAFRDPRFTIGGVGVSEMLKIDGIREVAEAYVTEVREILDAYEI